jgi:ubiquinone/menaquinone biosynthesis C-methylase UbiE
MVFRKDIIYHSDRRVVGSYDVRITRSYQFEHRYLTLHKWVGSFKKNNFFRILDFGCGTGSVSEDVAIQGMTAFAVDASLEMLQAVKRKAIDVQCAGGDGESLPFKDGAFDGLICMGVLHHIENKGRAVEEMIRVVRKGGRICISEPYGCRHPLMALYSVILFLPRMVRNMARGLHNLETEHPVSREELEESIQKTIQRKGKSFRSFFYVYLPVVFRFLPDRLAQIAFRIFNPHLKCRFSEGACEIEIKRKPLFGGNIVEIEIQC